MHGHLAVPGRCASRPRTALRVHDKASDRNAPASFDLRSCSSSRNVADTTIQLRAFDSRTEDQPSARAQSRSLYCGPAASQIRGPLIGRALPSASSRAPRHRNSGAGGLRTGGCFGPPDSGRSDGTCDSAGHRATSHGKSRDTETTSRRSARPRRGRGRRTRSRLQSLALHPRDRSRTRRHSRTLAGTPGAA